MRYWRCPTIALVAIAATGGIGAPAVQGAYGKASRRSSLVLANRCFALRSVARGRFVAVVAPDRYGATRKAKSRAARFYLKPTGLGTYMLYDGHRRLMAVEGSTAVGRVGTPGPTAEWSALRLPNRSFAIRSMSNGRDLAAGRNGGLVLVGISRPVSSNLTAPCLVPGPSPEPDCCRS